MKDIKFLTKYENHIAKKYSKLLKIPLEHVENTILESKRVGLGLEGLINVLETKNALQHDPYLEGAFLQRIFDMMSNEEKQQINDWLNSSPTY